MSAAVKSLLICLRRNYAPHYGVQCSRGSWLVVLEHPVCDHLVLVALAKEILDVWHPEAEHLQNAYGRCGSGPLRFHHLSGPMSEPVKTGPAVTAA